MHGNQDKNLDVSIVKAEYVCGLTLRLFFSDDVERIIDFSDFFASTPHPQHDKYSIPSNFREFRLEAGNVVWGDDWDLIFPVENLYRGCL
ncbi:MAG: DUF2442 domain-containing protein [Bacteroidales bacterium]|nr:DUF2442 domain-containing protein [Bacteroidales bacterium]